MKKKSPRCLYYSCCYLTIALYGRIELKVYFQSAVFTIDPYLKSTPVFIFV